MASATLWPNTSSQSRGMRRTKRCAPLICPLGSQCIAPLRSRNLSLPLNSSVRSTGGFFGLLVGWNPDEMCSQTEFVCFQEANWWLTCDWRFSCQPSTWLNYHYHLILYVWQVCQYWFFPLAQLCRIIMDYVVYVRVHIPARWSWDQSPQENKTRALELLRTKILDQQLLNLRWGGMSFVDWTIASSSFQGVPLNHQSCKKSHFSSWQATWLTSLLPASTHTVPVSTSQPLRTAHSGYAPARILNALSVKASGAPKIAQHLGKIGFETDEPCFLPISSYILLS